MLGICINCKHHIVNNGLQGNEHQCSYLGYAKTDFIVGTISYAKCYDKNKYGECQHFLSLNGDDITPPDNTTSPDGTTPPDNNLDGPDNNNDTTQNGD